MLLTDRQKAMFQQNNTRSNKARATMDNQYQCIVMTLKGVGFESHRQSLGRPCFTRPPIPTSISIIGPTESIGATKITKDTSGPSTQFNSIHAKRCRTVLAAHGGHNIY